MNNDLLQTKLFIPPLRPSLVPRARLLEQLNHNQHGKLTLVSAPAGFGKTTLVVAWLHASGQGSKGAGEIPFRACWLSLDENDNGLSRFFTYIIAAIRTAVPSFGSNLLSTLQSAQAQNETAVSQILLNELAQLISVGLILSGLPIFVMVSFPTLSVVLPVLVLVGIPVIVSFVSVQTLLQQQTEDAFRGRVFGAFGTTITLLMLIGSGIGGALADKLGAPALMNSAAIIYVAAGVLAFALLVKPTKEAMSTAEQIV